MNWPRPWSFVSREKESLEFECSLRPPPCPRRPARRFFVFVFLHDTIPSTSSTENHSSCREQEEVERVNLICRQTTGRLSAAPHADWCLLPTQSHLIKRAECFDLMAFIDSANGFSHRLPAEKASRTRFHHLNCRLPSSALSVSCKNYYECLLSQPFASDIGRAKWHELWEGMGRANTRNKLIFHPWCLGWSAGPTTAAAAARRKEKKCNWKTVIQWAASSHCRE